MESTLSRQSLISYNCENKIICNNKYNFNHFDRQDSNQSPIVCVSECDKNKQTNKQTPVS